MLFGVSGCGKTTVLRSAAGLEKAQGYVRIAGQVWQDDEKHLFVPTYKRRIGYVFQEASLFDHLNVRENLRFGLKRISDKDGEKRLDDAVELLGIFSSVVPRNSQAASDSAAPLPVLSPSSPRRYSWTNRWRLWITLVDWRSCPGLTGSRKNLICRFFT